MRLLQLGRATAREMHPVCDAIDRLGDDVELQTADTVEQALQLANDDHWFPDLAVVLQNWSDEFARDDVEVLLSQLPLTRWVCCFGAWCESDGRNRDIWPLAVRVPARCAVDRIRRDFGVLRGEKCALPLTAARDELYKFDHGDRLPAATGDRTVVIRSIDRALRQSLEDLLSCAGYAPWNGCEHEPPTAVLLDVDSSGDSALNELCQLRESFPNSAIVALMGLAHPEDVDDLLDAGADEVVAKLAPADVLFDAVQKAAIQRHKGHGRLPVSG